VVHLLTATANNTADSSLKSDGGLAVVSLMTIFWNLCVLLRVTADAGLKK
jgi:hypothetical protein